MRKITFVSLAMLLTIASNSFAGGTKPSAKPAAKCSMAGGSCCKQISRAAMMKARPTKAVTAAKKA